MFIKRHCGERVKAEARRGLRVKTERAPGSEI